MNLHTKRAFTLIELIVAFAIFTIVMLIVLFLVTGMFRNLRQGQRLVQRDQRQRYCFSRLSKELASLTRITYPETHFQGSPSEVFFVFAQEDNLVESKYSYNSLSHTLEHFSETPADYNENTYQKKDICIGELSDCAFSYSDGSNWKTFWNEDSGQLPQMIKLNFKLQYEEEERDFVVNVPVSP